VPWTILGWIGFALGPTSTWMLPRTRHGWLLGISCNTAWALVDIHIALWSGLAGAGLNTAAAWRNWRKHVGGPPEQATP
jgi:hypothetical protein